MAHSNEVCEESEMQRCVFLARYRKIGVNQFITVGRPEIEVADDPWPAAYQDPQVKRIGNKDVEIRVRDDSAVDLDVDSLMGDYDAAAQRCDEAILTEFPGVVIVDNLSAW